MFDIQLAYANLFTLLGQSFSKSWKLCRLYNLAKMISGNEALRQLSKTGTRPGEKTLRHRHAAPPTSPASSTCSTPWTPPCRIFSPASSGCSAMIRSIRSAKSLAVCGRRVGLFGGICSFYPAEKNNAPLRRHTSPYNARTMPGL